MAFYDSENHFLSCRLDASHRNRSAPLLLVLFMRRFFDTVALAFDHGHCTSIYRVSCQQSDPGSILPSGQQWQLLRQVDVVDDSNLSGGRYSGPFDWLRVNISWLIVISVRFGGSG